MKILIKEGIVKKMVNRVLGYDLSDHIEMVTNWIELGSRGQGMFSGGREEVRWLLNHFGPMYLFQIINDTSYLVQYQGSEDGWVIRSNKTFRKLSEDEFLDAIGIGFMGVTLQQVMDEFIEE